MFVFLSNTAGNLIQDYLHGKLESGIRREEVTVLEMERSIQRLLYKLVTAATWYFTDLAFVPRSSNEDTDFELISCVVQGILRDRGNS